MFLKCTLMTIRCVHLKIKLHPPQVRGCKYPKIRHVARIFPTLLCNPNLFPCADASPQGIILNDAQYTYTLSENQNGNIRVNKTPHQQDALRRSFISRMHPRKSREGADSTGLVDGEPSNLSLATAPSAICIVLG